MSVKEDRLVESLLFSAGKPLSIEEIQETTGLITETCHRGYRTSHAVV